MNHIFNFSRILTNLKTTYLVGSWNSLAQKVKSSVMLWVGAATQPYHEHTQVYGHIPCKPACGTGIPCLHSKAAGLGLLCCQRTPGVPHRLKTPTCLHYGPLTSSGSCKSHAVNAYSSLRELYIHTFWGPTPAWCWRKQGSTLLKPVSMKSMDKAVSVVAKQNFIHCSPN